MGHLCWDLLALSLRFRMTKLVCFESIHFLSNAVSIALSHTVEWIFYIFSLQAVTTLKEKHNSFKMCIVIVCSLFASPLGHWPLDIHSSMSDLMCTWLIQSLLMSHTLCFRLFLHPRQTLHNSLGYLTRNFNAIDLFDDSDLSVVNCLLPAIIPMGTLWCHLTSHSRTSGSLKLTKFIKMFEWLSKLFTMSLYVFM